MSVERSEGTQIYLFPGAKSCKVHTTSSTSTVVNYTKEGAKEEDEDYWFDIAIPETLVTSIKDDKLVSAALEGME